MYIGVKLLFFAFLKGEFLVEKYISILYSVTMLHPKL